MLLRRLAYLLILTSLMLPLLPTQAQQSAPVSQHPRLWIRSQEVETLRQIATPENPMWALIMQRAQGAAQAMDEGRIAAGDTGMNAWEEYPQENIALLFAFVSLLHPDPAQREDFAQRARTLLMAVISPAAQGVADGQPFRDTFFSTSDRSRWYGASFGLVVDWIYPFLSAEDKNQLAAVFTRWCDENRNAITTNNNHPEPIGVLNDPALVADPLIARWSNNNYYAAHTRNMALMSLALDASDDPNGALAQCRAEAIGAWAYVFDYLSRTDTLGGLGAEGFEYSPQTMGYMAQFLLALYTAGYSDPAQFGPQASFAANPFWDDLITAYLHSLSPAPASHDLWGSVYLPAWYGSSSDYYMPDHIEVMGALGRYHQLAGNVEGWNATRWIQSVSAPGGETGLLERMEHESMVYPILYFLLFPPDAPPPSDPRPALPSSYYAPGVRRLLARSDWSEQASWITYSLTWNTVDHQSANGNSVEFYRRGEWLTQIRPGYDLDYLASDNQNTLLIQNTPPEYDDWRWMLYEKGSQWLYIPSGDPLPPLIQETDQSISIYGDATNLYNSDYAGSTDVLQATRSVVWLKPDILVIYDQARTQNPGFKHFVLNLPATGTLENQQAHIITPGGQDFWILNLLPNEISASIVELGNEVSDDPANGNVMTHRYLAEAVGDPTEARFLHVLIGADAGAALPEVTLLSSDSASVRVQIGEIILTFEGQTINITP
jgi:hypothetical protein